MSNTSSIHSVTVTEAFVNEVMYYRLYINQTKIGDYPTLPEVIEVINLAVSMDDLISLAKNLNLNLNDQRND